MNTISEAVNDLDDLQYQMHCAINALDAIHTTMSCGEYRAEGYLDGLFGIYAQLDALNQKVKTKLIEAREVQKSNT